MVPPENRRDPETALEPVFRLLASEQRRYLLYLLREHESVTLDDLADILTGWLASRHGDTVATPEDRQRVYTKLYHVDVQKLVDSGVVEFDEGSGEVALAELSPAADQLLDCALELEPETTAEAIAAVDTGEE
jgi:DNA-binding transcriptional ArsR family regulator